MVLRVQSAEAQQRLFADRSSSAITKRFRKALARFIRQPARYPLLTGAYTLIADGLWYTFDDTDWVLYVLLLKPRRRNYAYLLDPIILPGRETYDNWSAAIDTIPEDMRARICAFVSDHFKASEKVVRHYGWIHQLCHFHLLAELQKRRGTRKRKIPGHHIREDIYQLVRAILVSEAGAKRDADIKKIVLCINTRDCPRALGMIVRGFLRALDQYHVYRTYPAHTIPRTTGAAESLSKLIRKRTRPLKTPQAVQDWAVAFCRLRKTITCNGQRTIEKNQPN